MKKAELSTKELVVFIGVSTDTIRRGVRTGEIPAIRVRTVLRLDRDEVYRCMQRKAEAMYVNSNLLILKNTEVSLEEISLG